VKSWGIPKPSARYVAKMEDVLDVYQQPYDARRPQVCLDEVAKTLRSIPRGEIPTEPGKPRRVDYEYQRHGACALFLAIEPLTGQRRVWARARRTMGDCAEVLRDLVDEVYPDAERIVLVVDNLNTHHAAALYERFEPAEARRIAAKIEWHYTPEHGSWLNIAECELSVLKRQCLKARMPDLETVRRAASAWEKRRNHQRITIDWRFTAAEARIKLKRLYPVVKEQESA